MAVFIDIDRQSATLLGAALLLAAALIVAPEQTMGVANSLGSSVMELLP